LFYSWGKGEERSKKRRRRKKEERENRKIPTVTFGLETWVIGTTRRSWKAFKGLALFGQKFTGVCLGGG